jgi:two-component system NarL family response regulator
MDLEMPDISGIDAMSAIRRKFPDARIIVLITHAGDVLVARAIKAVARDYLLKGLLQKELLETIRAVHVGQKMRAVLDPFSFLVISADWTNSTATASHRIHG